MKTRTQYLTTIAAAAIAAFGLSSCSKDDHKHTEEGNKHTEEGHKHTEEGHKHAEEGHKHAEEGHKHTEEGNKHAEEGHHHAKKAGPNGGRVITAFEPHAEFFVTGERKVRITFVDDDFKPVAAATQVASVIAGDRANPTELSFAADGDTLLSDKALPAGDNFPVVVLIKAGTDSDEVIANFQCNLKDCPTCDFKEYACICDHDEE